jgi:hypothetical protein
MYCNSLCPILKIIQCAWKFQFSESIFITENPQLGISLAMESSQLLPSQGAVKKLHKAKPHSTHTVMLLFHYLLVAHASSESEIPPLRICS